MVVLIDTNVIMDYLVTREQDFKYSVIPAVEPERFLEIFLGYGR